MSDEIIAVELKGAIAKIFYDIRIERRRQEALKADGRFPWTCADKELSDFEKAIVLAEEFGEVARAVLERAGLSADSHNVSLRRELIQVAAVCVAWVECLDSAEEAPGESARMMMDRHIHELKIAVASGKPVEYFRFKPGPESVYCLHEIHLSNFCSACDSGRTAMDAGKIGYAWKEDDATIGCDGHVTLEQAWRMYFDEPLRLGQLMRLGQSNGEAEVDFPNGYTASYWAGGSGIYWTASRKSEKQAASRKPPVQAGDHIRATGGIHVCGAIEFCRGCDLCIRWVGPGPNDLACMLKHHG